MISIIIPVYNVEKYLSRCLDSILNQTFLDWECILIDDGSQDESGIICDEYAAKEKRFQVIHQENKGVSVARNKGLDSARGEWIVFVDSDDWCSDTMLQDLYYEAIDKDADIIIGGYYLTDGKKTYKTILPHKGLWCIPQDFSTKWQGPCEKLFKKKIIDEYSIRFPEGITLAEDLLFTFNYFYNSSKVYGIEKPCYYYYQNKHSVCHEIKYNNVVDEIFVLNKIEETLKNKSNENWNTFLIGRKVFTKDKYIFSISKPDFKAWKECYSNVSNKEIMKYTPNSWKPVVFFACQDNFFLASIVYYIL